MAYVLLADRFERRTLAYLQAAALAGTDLPDLDDFDEALAAEPVAVDPARRDLLSALGLSDVPRR